MWKRFYTHGEFSWRVKSLCTGMGEGEIIVHNAAMNQNPNQSWSSSFPAVVHIFYINFKHQLLSIFFKMLEHFSDHF